MEFPHSSGVVGKMFENIHRGHAIDRSVWNRNTWSAGFENALGGKAIPKDFQRFRIGVKYADLTAPEKAAREKTGTSPEIKQGVRWFQIPAEADPVPYDFSLSCVIPVVAFYAIQVVIFKFLH